MVPKAVANKNARDEKKEAYLRAIYDRYTAEFHATEKQDASAIASSTHIAMDAVLQNDRIKILAAKISSAAKACSHCCREAVEIWPHEAALLPESCARRHDAGTWRG